MVRTRKSHRTQVQPDLKNAGDIFEELNETEIWQRLSRAWRHADNSEDAHSLRKVERLSALHWMRSMQNVLQQTLGMGFSDFVLEDGSLETAVAMGSNFPVLTVSLDQCSVGFSASWFMQYVLQMSMLVFPDPSHGNHNDLQGALRTCSSKLWSTVLRTTLAFNAIHGPWQGGAVWSRLLEAKEECAWGNAQEAPPCFGFFFLN